MLPALAIGALFDAAAGVLGLAPLALLLGLWPQRGSRSTRWLKWLVAALLLPLCVLVVFVAFSEFTFWNEFSSRFNFIAVDYLIYTKEVVGNIRESYNLPCCCRPWPSLALVLWALAWQALRPAWSAPAAGWRARCAAIAVWVLLLPALAFWAVDARYKEFSRNAQLNELAGNGYFDFWHAFRTNEIDYERYYRVMPNSQAVARLAMEITGHKPGDLHQHPNERRVNAAGPERRLNVVLVSVESLSAEFLGSFGNTQGLTPNLDRLARDGLLFTKLYATGTRTVRGLEALTLSVPPTPGQAIVKRPDNADLFTIGEVFKSKGYEALYLYGGYGYFDNMNAFFSSNGYTVVDRTALPSSDIHFENIWGVADEDLFTLTLRELDARQARGTPFFAHVMTTSNHRPFTYPAGRIDIPPKTGREGGVKYTDYAIGRFIDEARAKPWFAQTVFVIVADHTHNARGRQELPPRRLSHTHAHLCARPGGAGPDRQHRLADRRGADAAGAAEHELRLAILRPGHPSRGPHPPAGVPVELPDGGLLRTRTHRRVATQWTHARGGGRGWPACAGRRAEPRTAGRGHQLLPTGVTGLPQRRDEVAPLTALPQWRVPLSASRPGTAEIARGSAWVPAATGYDATP